jgi:hypothetical protein
MKQTVTRKFAPAGTYSYPAAARLVGVGVPALKKAVQKGEVPVRRINGRDRIPGEWIEKTLAAD